MYDYVFIGAGPSSLMAAYVLAKRGKSIKIIDQGRPVEQRNCVKHTGICKCEPCNILCGEGGAGTKSDAKLLFSAKSGGNLYSLGDKVLVDKCVEYVKQFYTQFSGFGLEPSRMKEKFALSNKCLESGLRFFSYPEMHIGSNNAEKTIINIRNELMSMGVDFTYNQYANTSMYGPEQKLVVAVGRAGHRQIENDVYDEVVDGVHRPVDIGIRFETLNSLTKHITDVQHDFKIISRYKDFQVRSFCVNPEGFVVTERHDQFALVNGHAESVRKSNNCNFAILFKCELTDPSPNTTQYAENIAKTFSDLGAGKPLVQRLEDLYNGRRTTFNRLQRSNIVPTLNEAVPGDISWAMPGIIQDAILDYIHKLDLIIPGIANGYNSLVYAPEIKFQCLDLCLNKDFSSQRRPNVFYIGDCSGKSGSIVSASVTGLLFALRQLNPNL